MAKGRAVTLFALALVMGLAAAWLAKNWADSNLLRQADNGVPVTVAAIEIPFGKKLEMADVRVMDMPSGAIPSGSFHEAKDVLGKVATQTIYAGEILLPGRVAEHMGGSALAAVINPDKRAVTVRVNDVIGVAGFLLPGNRVDVVATRRVGRSRVEAQTILQDLKVLAVDQTASPDKDKPVIVRAVTLETTPTQAEELVRATNEGSVQLTLRNPEDRAVAHKMVTRKRVIRRAPSDTTVTIIKGTAVSHKKVRT